VGGSGGTPIKGIVDEVFVYDRALSAQEIAALVSGLTLTLSRLSMNPSGYSCTTSTQSLTSRANHEHPEGKSRHHGPSLELFGRLLQSEARSVIDAMPIGTAVPITITRETGSTAMVAANPATRAKRVAVL